MHPPLPTQTPTPLRRIPTRMLHNGTINRKLVFRRLVVIGRRRLRQQLLEYGIDDVGVPGLRAGVVVGGCGLEGGVAGLCVGFSVCGFFKGVFCG